MGWEADFLLYIQDHVRSDLFNPFMTFITHTGDHGIFMIILVAVLMIIPVSRKTGFIAAISLAVEATLNNLLIKNIVARTRPYEAIDGLVNLIEKQKDFSFPSGHTGATFAVMGVVLFIAVMGIPVVNKSGELSRSKTGLPYKICTVIATLYAVLIAFSRLYVGVHYPTDVIGGFILGMGTSIGAYYIYRIILKKVSERKAKTASN